MTQWFNNFMLAAALTSTAAAADFYTDQKDVAGYPACLLLNEPEIKDVFGGPGFAGYLLPHLGYGSSYCNVRSGPKGEYVSLLVTLRHYDNNTGRDQLEKTMVADAAMTAIPNLGDLALESKVRDYTYELRFAQGNYVVTLAVADTKPQEGKGTISPEQVLKAAQYMATKDLSALAPPSTEQKDFAGHPACLLLTEPDIKEAFGGLGKATYAKLGQNESWSHCAIGSGPQGEYVPLYIELTYFDNKTGRDFLEMIMSDAGTMTYNQAVPDLGDLALESKDYDYKYRLEFAQGNYLVKLSLAPGVIPEEGERLISRDQVLKAARFIAARDLSAIAPVPFAN